MLRILLLCTIIAAFIGGCANGWPRVHAPPKTVANCVPTTSRIARRDCVLSTPATQTSQGDADRVGQPPSPGRISSMPRN